MRPIRPRRCMRPWASGTSRPSGVTCGTRRRTAETGGDMIDTTAMFEDARTYTAWQERPVTDELLRRVYDLAKLGPASSNCCPRRALELQLPLHPRVRRRGQAASPQPPPVPRRGVPDRLSKSVLSRDGRPIPGGWRRGRGVRGLRSGTPESRAQLEELRFGRVG